MFRTPLSVSYFSNQRKKLRELAGCHKNAARGGCCAGEGELEGKGGVEKRRPRYVFVAIAKVCRSRKQTQHSRPIPQKCAGNVTFTFKKIGFAPESVRDRLPLPALFRPEKFDFFILIFLIAGLYSLYSAHFHSREAGWAPPFFLLHALFFSAGLLQQMSHDYVPIKNNSGLALDIFCALPNFNIRTLSLARLTSLFDVVVCRIV